jgi:hypothetical protein
MPEKLNITIISCENNRIPPEKAELPVHRLPAHPLHACLTAKTNASHTD